MTELFLVRHGRTELNAEGRFQGEVDSPLDILGQQQVERMARWIGAPGILISSPRLRCRQSAEAFGVPYEIDERWEELHYGDLDGQRLADFDPEMWAAWRSDPSFRPAAGAETLLELDERIAVACDALCLRFPNDRVVVVTHVSPIKSALVWALGAGPRMHWKFRVGQATLTRIEIGSLGPMVAGFNESPPAWPTGS